MRLWQAQAEQADDWKGSHHRPAELWVRNRALIVGWRNRLLALGYAWRHAPAVASPRRISATPPPTTGLSLLKAAGLFSLDQKQDPLVHFAAWPVWLCEAFPRIAQ